MKKPFDLFQGHRHLLQCNSRSPGSRFSSPIVRRGTQTARDHGHVRTAGNLPKHGGNVVQVVPDAGVAGNGDTDGFKCFRYESGIGIDDGAGAHLVTGG